MPKNEQNQELCVHLVENYGVCSRTAEHIVHKMHGISPVEHLFQREEKGDYKTAVLSKRNLKRVSKASGMAVEDLEVIRQVGIRKGKKMTVRWLVKEND